MRPVNVKKSAYSPLPSGDNSLAVTIPTINKEKEKQNCAEVNKILSLKKLNEEDIFLLLKI